MLVLEATVTTEGRFLVRNALPFLAELPSDTLERIVRGAHLEVAPADFLKHDIRRLRECGYLRSVAASVASESLEAVLTFRFKRLVPSLELLAGLNFAPVGASRRLMNLLARNKMTGWRMLAEHTPGEILSLRNAGRVATAECFAVVIEHSLLAQSGAPGAEVEDQDALDSNESTDDQSSLAESVPPRSPWSGLVEPLRTIAAWASAERGYSSLPEAFKDVDVSPDLPQEVVDAWDQLSAFDLAELGGAEVSFFDPTTAARRVLDQLDDRDRHIVLTRMLNTEVPPTLDELARQHQITRERVRQVAERGIRRLQMSLAKPENQVLARAGRRLRAELGSAYPLKRFLAEQPSFVPGIDTYAAEVVHLRLLLWLAGPYEIYRDWLVLKPADALVACSRDALSDATADGPVELSSVVERIVQLGVRNEFCQSWISEVASRGFLIDDDRLIPWGGTLADKAALILAMERRPMSGEEISRRIPEPHSVGTLSNYLRGDSRFCRRDVDRYGLTELGGDEYTSVQEEIVREIEREGGRPRLTT